MNEQIVEMKIKDKLKNIKDFFFPTRFARGEMKISVNIVKNK